MSKISFLSRLKEEVLKKKEILEVDCAAYFKAVGSF